ncbi:Homeobox domain [Ostreococcus tauri]|uniref:Homeobox domain n=1 Tax=Ostreococcus tauri TaxID=70448 RepID=A0A096PA34_OSTTA|nr:Homeobox domain [Ostreococcus tauri]CEG00787.1 Homeobox domain [Ostreococcus tauri]|eukprot:XP_003084219.2 Homeobox domain [Ostreococcus tauri]
MDSIARADDGPTRRRRDAPSTDATEDYMTRARRLQSAGVDERGLEVLRGVYELERRPDAATRRRLARQIGAREEAVNAWFRSRRAEGKRRRARRALCVVALLVLAAGGVFLAIHVARQTAFARRRMQTLGRRYKWLTRSGLPRPYASGRNRAVARKPLTYERERVINAAGKEEVRQVIYTKDNPKASPITRTTEETPRQKLERLRYDAAKRSNKGRIKAQPQPNRVRQSNT